LKTYDPKCAELARHFLGEEADDDAVEALAVLIQETVEEHMGGYA
jgi:hypothetical protein